ncbi:hypothetical protein L2E82_24921 [Cichorium intybus]|uniref:Uncharacterized protein n=1 Tax=Cichorium intybus TaxID=13427 RepID=A0ACB9E284_CICIN|nr:hypothetical protein L2E82_24921 [Cichorium intybus]
MNQLTKRINGVDQFGLMWLPMMFSLSTGNTLFECDEVFDRKPPDKFIFCKTIQILCVGVTETSMPKYGTLFRSFREQTSDVFRSVVIHVDDISVALSFGSDKNLLLRDDNARYEVDILKLQPAIRYNSPLCDLSLFTSRKANTSTIKIFNGQWMFVQSWLASTLVNFKIIERPTDIYDPMRCSSDDISIRYPIFFSPNSIMVLCTVTSNGSRVFSLLDYTLRLIRETLLMHLESYQDHAYNGLFYTDYLIYLIDVYELREYIAPSLFLSCQVITLCNDRKTFPGAMHLESHQDHLGRAVHKIQIFWHILRIRISFLARCPWDESRGNVPTIFACSLPGVKSIKLLHRRVSPEGSLIWQQSGSPMLPSSRTANPYSGIANETTLMISLIHRTIGPDDLDHFLMRLNTGLNHEAAESMELCFSMNDSYRVNIECISMIVLIWLPFMFITDQRVELMLNSRSEGVT